jgi:hypothetical protein
MKRKELVEVTDTNDKTATRRIVLLRGIGVGAGLAAVAGLARPAAAQGKIAPAMVQYQKTPKGTQKCGDCAQYVDPNACKIVDGTIDPNGWCIAFAPKS